MKLNFAATCMAALATISPLVISAADNLPPVKLTSFNSEVKYVSKPDYTISDEFNSDSEYETKWRRRIEAASNGKSVNRKDLDLVAFERDKEVGYISFKGVADDEKGTNIRTSGIVSKTTAYGGFYVTRFRILGLDTPKCKTHGTIWHPSIWCAKWGSDYDASKFKKDESWLEIDLMEWEGKGWSCDAPARFLFSNGEMGKVNDRDKAKFGAIKASVLDMDDNYDREHTEWTTLGMEYNSKYIRLWEYKDGEWRDISSRTVEFVAENPARLEDSFRKGTLGHSAYKPVKWILGNVTAPWILSRLSGDNDAKRPSCEDMSFDVDFFRYYPCK